MKCGPPPTIVVGRKSLQGGRRCVTWCAGMEAFRVDPKVLCGELAKLLAAAATLQPAAPLGFSIEGLGGDSVACVVQGDEVERVREYLCTKLDPQLVSVFGGGK